MSSNPIQPADNERDDAYRAWCDYHALGQDRSIRRLIEHYKQTIIKLYAQQQHISVDAARTLAERNLENVKATLQDDLDYASLLPPSTRRATLEGWSRTFDWQERLKLVEKYLQDERFEKLKKQQMQIIDDDIEDYQRELKSYRELAEAAKLHQRRVKKTVERQEVNPQTGELVTVREEATIVKVNVGDYLGLAKLRTEISNRGRRAVELPNNISDQRLSGDTGTVRNNINLIFPKGYEESPDEPLPEDPQ